MAKEAKPVIINIKNRRASHEYSFLAKYDAGVMLQGTEIKSIREGNVNMSDGYCTFDQRGDLWIHSHPHRALLAGHLQQPRRHARPQAAAQ